MSNITLQFIKMPRGKSPHTVLARPYRSHKVPACNRCRQRKIRCLADEATGPCRPCAESDSQCNRQSGSRVAMHRQASQGARASRRRREPVQTNASKSPIPSQSTLVATSNETESALIVGPAVAEDLDSLERYLTSHDQATKSPSTSHGPVIGAKEPIHYFKIPRGRQGMPPATDAGKPQREILEQIIGRPFQDEVIDLFFHHIHPCFPILDKAAFMELWRRNPSKLSSTLLCDVYASALLFWHKSANLHGHPQPDMAFAWNQAVLALNSDFTAPTLSTIHAALIDMSGRPVLGITDNVLNIGRVVNLAQSLGLHRVPSNWNIPLSEKNLRIRLWWGVYVHDIWSSFAHGIPPSTSPSFADVPSLALDHLQAEEGHSSWASASSFVNLCSLTAIVANALPEFYSVGQTPGVLQRLIAVENAFDKWSTRSLDRSPPLSDLSVDGFGNVWLCYLLARLLFERLAVKIRLRTLPDIQMTRTTMSDEDTPVNDRASKLMQFVSELQPAQLQGFWFPYVAHLLPSCVTVFLRCIVDMRPGAARTASMEQVEHFIISLQRFRRDHRWDIGDLCLERCSDAVKRVSDMVKRQSDDADESAATSRSNLGPVCPFAEQGEFSAMPTFLLDGAYDGLDMLWDGACFDFDR